MNVKDENDLLREIFQKISAIEEKVDAGLISKTIEEHNVSLDTVAWTHSKTDLIELIYALHASGAFNNGKCTIREITNFFENAFSLNLGNTSMTFQEILRRKDSTAFLEHLKDKLDLYITKIEEKNIR